VSSTERTYAATLDSLARAVGAIVERIEGEAMTTVTGLSYDSHAVAPGDLFFCIVGAKSDGHAFARAAAEAGAVALCVERPTGAGLPELVVRDARVAMGELSAAFFGRPADDLLMLGVTGTNGKTTTTYLLESILRADGRTTGLIGTVETRVGNESRPGVRTTPESLDLHRLFAEMRDGGVDAVAMEVTSHALVLRRVAGLRFAVATFTNLTQDHLDFHADMEDYFAAKRSLFIPELAERGAINADDLYGARLADETSVPSLRFGSGAGAEVRAHDVVFSPSASTFRIVTPKGDVSVTTRLVGDFNVSNCLAAAATALQAGVGLGAIEKGISSLAAVPGRFEVVDAGQPFTVLVDYAHTPDSLDNVLRAARSLTRRGRLICVFGCGGDRDKGKRPLMGAVVAQLADVVVITSDNPRSENPDAIIGEIIEGVIAERADGPDVADPDRRRAIEAAVGAARPGDVVVIAGKGHETQQEFADRTIPFDDRAVAHAVLEALPRSSRR
jgi:UDP-N-acetylmuramoyl-L-alanyl-D-glutamate--2,6-diaminopimelate ligase